MMIALAVALAMAQAAGAPASPPPTAGGPAGSGPPLTLGEAIATAYRGNPTLNADREGLKILDEDVATARSAGRPSLIAEGTLARSEIDVVGTGSVLGVRATQPVSRGGRVGANIRAAETNVLAGRESLRQSEIEITEQAVTAYASVLRDRELVAHNDAAVTNMEVIATAEARKLDLGEGRLTDVAQARARLGGAIVARDTARQRLADSIAAFEQVTGLSPDRLAPLPPLPPVAPSRDRAFDEARAESPAVRQARLSEQVARFQERAAIGNLLPTVDASANVQRRNEIVQILGRRIEQTLGTFLLTISVPLFQGGGEYAAVRRARHVTGVRRFEIEEIEREVETEVAVAWARLVTSRDSAARLADVVGENERALAGVTRESEFGARTILDVLDAEGELRNARIAETTSRYAAYVAAVQLAAATGTLTPESLGAAIERYRPEDHYDAVHNRWIGFNP